MIQLLSGSSFETKRERFYGVCFHADSCVRIKDELRCLTKESSGLLYLQSPSFSLYPKFITKTEGLGRQHESIWPSQNLLSPLMNKAPPYSTSFTFVTVTQSQPRGSSAAFSIRVSSSLTHTPFRLSWFQC